jgi:nickel transport protein
MGKSMRWLIAVLIAAQFPLTATAHDLGAEITLEGDRVCVVAYYDDNVAAADASVVVLDKSKNEVHRGTTDEKGLWTFPQPAPGTYFVTIDAGQGHWKLVRLTISTHPDGQAIAITTEPSRAQFTRSRFPQLLVGIAAIMAGALALQWLLLQVRRDKIG